MNQLLDLSITLTSPPLGSPLEVIASISLHCDILGLTCASDLLKNPLTRQEYNDLRWYLEEYWKWPYEQFAKRANQIEELLRELGKRLYDATFGSHEATTIVRAWQLQTVDQRQISIVSDMPRVLSLPWELFHDNRGFLALRTRYPVSIVRCLPNGGLALLPTPFEPPLRILLVSARPEDAGFI